jgi:hypothetical protein
VHWSHMAQDRNLCGVLANTLINFQVPYNVGKFFSVEATGGFSKTHSAPRS